VPVGYALVLLIFWAVNRMSVTSVVIANLLSNVLAVTLALCLTLPGLVKIARKSGVSWFAAKNLRRDLKYGITAQIGTLQPFTDLQIDVLALTLIATAQDLGLYTAALAGANLIRAQGYALGQVVLPEVARHDDVEQQKRIIRRTMALATACGAIAFMIAMLWSEVLLQLVYGTEFVPAATMLKILALAGAVKAVERVLADGLRGMGHPSISTKGELIGLGVGLPALVICTPFWGGVGAAAAVLVASLASFCAAAWQMHSRSVALPSIGGAQHVA
jgi:O-antigen/teichoic acid export membrane protein